MRNSVLFVTILLSISLAQGFFRTGPYFGKRGTQTKRTSEIFSGKDTKDIEIMREIAQDQQEPFNDMTRSRQLLLQAFKRLSDRGQQINRFDNRKRQVYMKEEQGNGFELP